MAKNLKGTLLVISGPSGCGKGTIVRELLLDESFALSISVTTRRPRYNEEEGIHYFFRSKAQFETMIKEGSLLEWAEFVGNYYGTPMDYVTKKLKQGKNVILEIEVNGAIQVKNIFPECALIFIAPPSLMELKKRLLKRGTEDALNIKRRNEKAKEELNLIESYDYVVVNDIIFKAVEDIKNIVRAEPLKVFRNIDVIERLKGEIVNA